MLAILLTCTLQFSEIGERIWQNECNKDVEKLVFWNARESFPSLGIGHFIWLPKDSKEPFEETFPKLVQFLKNEHVSIPTWMEGPCPWKDREAFLSDRDSEKMRQLRALTRETIPLQARFLTLRLEEVEPRLKAQQSKIDKLKQSSEGLFALLDYLNFKGSGLSEKERYEGKGWGLLQVLEEMSADGSVREFVESAKTVLKKRVANAPPEKNEERWLKGWITRVESYCDGHCK